MKYKHNIFGMMIGLTLLSACSQNNKAVKEEIKEEPGIVASNDVRLSNQREFFNNIKFTQGAITKKGKTSENYIQLMNKKLLERKDVPQNPNEVSNGIFLFNNSYLSTNNISDHNTTISAIAFFSSIDYNDIKTSNSKGLAFYPVVITTDGNPYFSFVLVKAEKTPSLITPIPHTSGSVVYNLLTKSGISTINQSEFNTMKNYYVQNVKIKNLNSTYDIGNDNLNHPGAVFYHGDSLAMLISQNNVTPNNGFSIKISNVGAAHKGVNPLNLNEVFYLHSALITVQKNGVDQLNNVKYPSNIFKMKAMDIGYPCPPCL